MSSIRQVSNVPILFYRHVITMDQVMSMELGADDYYTFSYQRTNCEVTSNLSTRISDLAQKKDVH